MLDSWKDELEGFVASAGERTPTELINGIRDIGVAMGHETGEALLDSHPELFTYRSMLTQAFIEMVRDPHYREHVVPHRTAAVADSRLLCLSPLDPGGDLGH